MVKYECNYCGKLISMKYVVIAASYQGSSDYYHTKCWKERKKGDEEE